MVLTCLAIATSFVTLFFQKFSDIGIFALMANLTHSRDLAKKRRPICALRAGSNRTLVMKRENTISDDIDKNG